MYSLRDLLRSELIGVYAWIQVDLFIDSIFLFLHYHKKKKKKNLRHKYFRFFFPSDCFDRTESANICLRTTECS